MNVLITGATVRIGRVLARSLADVGLPVTIITRRPHRVFEAFGDTIQACEWHPLSEAVPAAAMAGVDTIVHLMGDPLQGRLTPARLKRLTASRVSSLNRLIAAVAGRPIRLIMASNIGIYPGMGARSCDADGEHSPLGGGKVPKPVTSALQEVIADWEAAAQPLIDGGSAVAFVRLGAVICADGFPSALLSLKARGLPLPLEPACSVPAISLQDAAAIFAWLVLNPGIAGAINAVAPVCLTGAAINDALQPVARDRWPLPLFSGRPLRWLARRRLGIGADLVCGDRRVAPQRAIEGGFEFSHPDPAVPLRAAVAAQRRVIEEKRQTSFLSRMIKRGSTTSQIKRSVTGRRQRRK